MTALRHTMACPHYLSRMRTIASRQLRPLVREFYFDCANVDGCRRCVARLGIVRDRVPSPKPNSQVSLPFVEHSAGGISMPAFPISSGKPLQHRRPVLEVPLRTPGAQDRRDSYGPLPRIFP